MVIDAAVLTTFDQVSAATQRVLKGRLIVTPNRQEAATVVKSLAEEERHEDPIHALACAAEAVVSCFGHVNGSGNRAWKAKSTNAALGTSGSGDVRAGLMAGAAARCRHNAHAACWATFLHIAAGRRLHRRNGDFGYLARELIDEIGSTMLSEGDHHASAPGVSSTPLELTRRVSASCGDTTNSEPSRFNVLVVYVDGAPGPAMCNFLNVAWRTKSRCSEARRSG